MSQALALDSKPVALEIHALLKDLDPARELAAGSVTQRAARIAEQIAEQTASLVHVDAGSPIAERLSELRTLLRERMPRPDMPKEAWNRYRLQLQAAYEELSASLRERQVHVPALRPTNYVRSSFHVLVAVALVVLVEEVLSAFWRAAIPTAFALFFWTLEGLRHVSPRARSFLLWLFRSIAHPHERYRVNSSTWFTTALSILGLFFSPVPTVIAIIVLGVGDPAAALVGRRFGRTKLVGNRSLEGTLTFVAAGTLAALAVLAIWHPTLALPAMLAAALSGALSGALAELFSGRLDDNLTIPLSAGAGAQLALWLAGA